MSVKFECPNCHEELQVADEHVGKVTNCPKCGREFNIPAKGALDEQGEESTHEIK